MRSLNQKRRASFSPMNRLKAAFDALVIARFLANGVQPAPKSPARHREGVAVFAFAAVVTASIAFAATPINTWNTGWTGGLGSGGDYFVNGGGGPYSTGTNYEIDYNGYGRVLEDFTIGGEEYIPSVKASDVKVRRKNNSNITGERQQLSNALWRTNNNGLQLDFLSQELKTAEDVFLNGYLTTAVENAFNNDQMNIERIDWIWSGGISTPGTAAELDEFGFVVLERDGNNAFKIAAITAIDAFGNATALGALHDGLVSNYGTAGWYPADSVGSEGKWVLTRNQANGTGELKPYSNVTNQSVKGQFVSYSDLGLSTNDTFYGYVLLPPDVNSGMDLIGLSNVPTNSSGETFGGDWYGGGQFVYRAGGYYDPGVTSYNDIPVDPNPDYIAECATDVAIVLDRSTSIVNGNLTQGVRDAFTGFVDQLNLNRELVHPNADVKLSTFRFGTNAFTDIVGLSITDSTVANEFNTFINTTYDPPPSGQGTNYDEAFQEVFFSNQDFDYVVFLSDGVPTYWQDPDGNLRGSGSNGDSNDATTGDPVTGAQNVLNSAAEGAQVANLIKQSGVKIYFAGIDDGNAFSTGSGLDVIRAITDDNNSEEFDPVAGNASTADYVIEDVTTMAQRLRELVNETCPPVTLISGSVYHDQNQNDVYDGAAEDWGGDIAYVALLDANTNEVLAYQNAGLDGLYEFIGYTEGSYEIVLSRTEPVVGQVIPEPTPPVGWTTQTPTPGRINVTVVSGTFLYENNDFGLYQPPATNQQCYAVADGAPYAVEVNVVDASEVILWNNSATLPNNLEAGDVDPSDSNFYFVATGSQAGYINLSTGLYTSLPSAFGSGSVDGVGTESFSTVTGMAFDPTTGYLYVVEENANSALARVDKNTGAILENGFGTGVDFVRTGIDNLEGLSVDPTTGQMYAITNTQLYTIDKITGASQLVGPVGTPTDLEGLGFTSDGQLIGSSGNGDGGDSNSIWDINKSSGAATGPREMETYSDYETIDCFSPLSGQPTAQLSVVKTDGQESILATGDVTYTITVANAGPQAAYGVAVSDAFPAGLENVTWTCAASGGASCLNDASGSGDINALVDLPPSGEVVFTVSASAVAGFVGDLQNTATVTTPPGLIDDPSDNTSTDTTAVTAAPLEAVKTVGLRVDQNDDGNVDAGDVLVYTVEYVNPSVDSVDVTNFMVSDELPSQLSYVAGTLVLEQDPSGCVVGAAVNNGYSGTAANDDLLASVITLPTGCGLLFTFHGKA